MNQLKLEYVINDLENDLEQENKLDKFLIHGDLYSLEHSLEFRNININYKFINAFKPNSQSELLLAASRAGYKDLSFLGIDFKDPNWAIKMTKAGSILIPYNFTLVFLEKVILYDHAKFYRFLFKDKIVSLYLSKFQGTIKHINQEI